MGIWNLSAVHEKRYKAPAAGAPAFVSAGTGYADATSTRNYAYSAHNMWSRESFVIAVVHCWDSSWNSQSPDERQLTATFHSQPMTLIGYQDRCAVFAGFTDPNVYATKYLRVQAPTKNPGNTDPSYYWAINTAAFSNVDTVTNVVVNPTNYPSTMNSPLTASLTSVANSITVWCIGVYENNEPGLPTGTTKAFFTGNGSYATYPAAGLYYQTGNGSAQSFSANPWRQGSVVACSLSWSQ